MKEHVSVITRKGQVTIPAEIRRALSLNEGDKIAFEVEEDRIHIAARRGSVVERTAGALKSTMLISAELRPFVPPHCPGAQQYVSGLPLPRRRSYLLRSEKEHAGFQPE